jgi:polysaccharide deacetylase family protein (PEP-CTERM system associated)
MNAPATFQTREWTPPATGIVNAVSVDVEDYFQVEAFKSVIAPDSWDNYSPRVAHNTRRVLELMSAADTKGTFFVLGWVAQRFPNVVKEIGESGHEVACHGFDHERVQAQSPQQFREDIHKAKALLEDISGKRVRGYRAPTFSINDKNWWSFDVLADEGFDYSSSVYPIAHDLYGMPQAPRGAFFPLAGSNFLEVPISTVRFMGRNYPAGGGGYFRLLPYPVSRMGVRHVNQKAGMPSVFYCHPWEFDPEQPRIESAPLKSRIRHYMNISAMSGRFGRLLRDFRWGRMDDIFLERA